MRVLLVDDDPEMRFIAGFLLRSAGCTVVEADTSTAAAAQLHDHDVDVMLMDVMLGTEDGIAVAERLRDQAAAAPVLIFLTGAARVEQVERMQRAGAAGIVHKPFDPETFAATIQRLVHAS